MSATSIISHHASSSLPNGLLAHSLNTPMRPLFHARNAAVCTDVLGKGPCIIIQANVAIPSATCTTILSLVVLEQSLLPNTAAKQQQ
jgi:hypothetical protein